MLFSLENLYRHLFVKQYRHWRQVFAGDVVLTQIGAFIEVLQWPPRRLSPRTLVARGHDAIPGRLRRMRPTRRWCPVNSTATSTAA